MQGTKKNKQTKQETNNSTTKVLEQNLHTLRIKTEKKLRNLLH